MFYKDEFPTDKKNFIKENPLEFAITLANKFKGFSHYSTGFLKATDHNGNEVLIQPVIYNSKSLAYLTHRGERALSKYFVNSLSNNNPGFTNFGLISSDISHLTPNPDIQLKMQELLTDFFNIKVEKKVKDKNGHKYNIKIVSNADDTIGSSLIVDTLFLYDGDKKAGHIKVKYTKKDLIKKIYGSLEHANAKTDKLFINLAGVDYSRLEDEYQNKGLGYVMYFHMAQHLENEGIKFRSSTIQSPLAKRLWEGINKNWGEYVQHKKIGKENCSFLKMTKDLEFYFEDNSPKIKKIKLN